MRVERLRGPSEFAGTSETVARRATVDCRGEHAELLYRCMEPSSKLGTTGLTRPSVTAGIARESTGDVPMASVKGRDVECAGPGLVPDPSARLQEGRL